MNNIEEYITNFFTELEMWEDLNNKQNNKSLIHKAVINFLRDCKMETAFKVYEAFFTAYWIGIQNDKNPFIELLKKMKAFEESAGVLLPKHRDHFVHSAYVFILGLAIYAQNKNYSFVFDKIILDKTVYKDSYDTKSEEFFYRWGIASLFHDIAYPLEISINQINIYIDFISNHSDIKSNNIKVKMIIDNIEDFNCLPQIMPLAEFSNDFTIKYPNCMELNLADSIDLLAYKLHTSFQIDVNKVRENLIDFALDMQEQHFIDHGYYSALIVLRWYYYLIQKEKWNPAYFYFPIVDSASAILLHNYYKHGLMKSPFKLGKFKIQHNPIAYLLILCDELQDWNRTGYGEFSINELAPIDFDIFISDKILELIYVIDKGVDPNDYIDKKLKSILHILQSTNLFPQGIKLSYLRKDEENGQEKSMYQL